MAEYHENLDFTTPVKEKELQPGDYHLDEKANTNIKLFIEDIEDLNDSQHLFIFKSNFINSDKIFFFFRNNNEFFFLAFNPFTNIVTEVNEVVNGDLSKVDFLNKNQNLKLINTSLDIDKSQESTVNSSELLSHCFFLLRFGELKSDPVDIF